MQRHEHARYRDSCANLGRLGQAGTFAIAATLSVTQAAAQAVPPAADVQRARELFARGEAAEQSGNFAGSCALFTQVAAIKSSASVRYHLGLCETKLGHWSIGLAHYEQAQLQAVSENKPEVLAAVAAPLAELSKRTPKVRFELGQTARNAAVTIDGRTVTSAELEQPIALDPGAHLLRAETGPKGARTGGFRRTVTVSEGERQTIFIELNAEPEPAALLTSAADSPAASTHSLSRLPAVLTTAGALAAIGGGIASVLYAGNIAEQARRECPARVTCDDERQRVRTWDTLALGGFVVGAGLGVLSVVLWTRKSRSTAAIHATTNTSVSRSLRSTSARLGFSAQSFTIAGEF